jgi:hypothetical protein
MTDYPYLYLNRKTAMNDNSGNGFAFRLFNVLPFLLISNLLLRIGCRRPDGRKRLRPKRAR